eukprot:TRINITY_DN23733_c0_g1_i1.p1 TRINITY_DN23733_c0_g1~~TRINITY_DN23733_c0_g1_i1.p1  ORF type:complete len:1180 (+),score=248.85 TRINITY_DN23733_c0_g1_i1:95-3634(+)
MASGHLLKEECGSDGVPKNGTDGGRMLPAQPVRLFTDREDPCVGQLQVFSFDQVGLLFRICELLTSHGIDICSAQINTEDGVVHNHFELRTSRPSDFGDALEWCKELEEVARMARGPASESSLAAVSKRLSVNPDLVSVVSFEQHASSDKTGSELRYSVDLEGINQAGLLTYTALVFYRCGFSVVRASITTSEGHFVDSFELTTTSQEAENLLRSHLDVPGGENKEPAPLPFHATQSDVDLQALMHMWGKQSSAPGFASPPSLSRAPSLNEIAEESSDVFGSRLPSSGGGSEDHEEPSNQAPFQEATQEVLPKRSLETPRSRSGNGRSSPSPSRAALEQRPSRRKMSVQFVNGDVYTGNCKQFEDGEKRHGLGTYVYSGGTHEIYKQYHGQWREDKKHGYGVLFYRNGGVYVGQWVNNQKHGLGVLLDTSSQTENLAAMPTYRYEGNWQEDQPHGLGTEENDMMSYCGSFVHGRHLGRGIRMNLAKTAVSGCEVLDSNSQPVPFLEALEHELDALHAEELQHLKRVSAPGGIVKVLAEEDLELTTSGATYHCGSREASRTALADLAFPQSGSDAPSTNSTSTASGKHSTPHARSLQRNGSNNDVAGMATPALQPGGCCPGYVRGSSPAGTGTASPGRLSSFDSGAGDGANTNTTSQSEGKSSGTYSPVSRPREKAEVQTGASVEFSMWEENDLLSPEDKSLAAVLKAKGTGSLSGADGKGSRRMLAKSTTDPWAPGKAGDGTAFGGSSSSAAAAAPAGNAAAQESASSTRRASDMKPHTIRKSPLLWTEEELAAFIACLGINKDVCRQVMLKKVKGISQLLEMSNSQLRRAFGLVSPVERLVVRHALKRVLDAARWGNSFCGHKAGDILCDSVLSRFIVPMDELTLVTKISQGGYGTVYRGVLEPTVDRAGGKFQAKRSHLVAVKEMKGERRVQLYELLKEACVMASLNHPNICTFVGVSTDAAARKHLIISELMDCSLFDIIHQPYKLRWHGELTISIALSLATGIVSGIVYIHAKSLVHADLKSSNILIDYSSSRQLLPRICDFGHAAVRCHPSPHHRCGTPHWAGPEVLRGEALGPAADIYSFGVIMWEMLAQRLPHKGLSFGQVLGSVGWAGWTPDMSQLPGLPREVYQLIKDCLSFAPSDRPEGKIVLRHLKRFPKLARYKALKLLAAFLGSHV